VYSDAYASVEAAVRERLLALTETLFTADDKVNPQVSVSHVTQSCDR
jgi:hypothetical protein